jgi:hypothetical protein
VEQLVDARPTVDAHVARAGVISGHLGGEGV